MKEYTKFIVTTIPYNPDIIGGILWELDIKGIEEKEAHLFVFADSSSTEIHGQIEGLLSSLRNNNMIESFTVEEEKFENKNWNEEWEKKFDIIKVTERIIIRPAFKNYIPNEGEIVVTIIPKMSFGTGEHETTRLVLSMIDKYVKKDDFVLDVGSGTGILAITSVKLGASSALGIDNDEWCLLNGKENIELNNLESKIDIRLCKIDDVVETGFDLIVANINKPILLEIAEKISQKVKQSGIIILSGLLLEDKEHIIPQYQKYGFALLEQQKQNEWAMLVFRKD
ncbi:MAG: 50S ribosomal protein L11 methyltransferase [bacterium]